MGEYYSLFILGYDRELRFQQEKLSGLGNTIADEQERVGFQK